MNLKWFRKSLITIFLWAISFGVSITASPIKHRVYAQNKTPINVHVFWQNGCPHCEEELKTLRIYETNHPGVLKLYDYNLASRTNQEIAKKAVKEVNATLGGVPLTIIGNRFITGWPTTGGQSELYLAQLLEKVESARVEEWPDVVMNVQQKINDKEDSKGAGEITEETKGQTQTLEKIDILFFKNINLKNLSLPIVTILLALADGLNPCAMWVLLFLISLLIGIEDKKKMWLLGGTFIFASSLVYFLILSAWLNLFLYIGFLTWIRVIIGVVALAAGFNYLKDFYENETGCKIMGGNEKRQKVFKKLRSFVGQKNLLLALIGIAGLAFAVNIVEFFCSAGLPAVYTNMLSMANLPKTTYYLYLLLYVLVFMVDDFIVFFIAMTTLKATGIESKYARYSHLIGGILIIVIGVLMLVKPELLMFG